MLICLDRYRPGTLNPLFSSKTGKLSLSQRDLSTPMFIHPASIVQKQPREPLRPDLQKLHLRNIVFCFSFRGRKNGTSFLIISNSFCKNSRGTAAPKRGEGHTTGLQHAGLKQVIKAQGPQVCCSCFSVISPCLSSWEFSQPQSSIYRGEPCPVSLIIISPLTAWGSRCGHHLYFSEV